MLLRKRAWDILREDYPRVADEATLLEIIRALAGAEGKPQEADAVVVLGPEGDFAGLVTMDDVLAILERNVFRGAPLDGSQGGDWDEAFRRACLGCGEVRAKDLARPDEPAVHPNDPLLMVVESFLDRGRNTAVVREGDRVLGVVLKADAFREVGREVLGGA
jgi:predicted transcriptional regulator